MSQARDTADPIGFEGDDGVGVITLRRAHARNAITPVMAQGIEAAIDRIEADDTIAAGVLCAEPPVFSAGADLRVVGEGRAAELLTDRGGFAGLARRVRTKPLIAAVDGPAVAGGLEIVLACDLVVASPSARFALPEVKRGLVASSGGLVRLALRIPRAIALEVVLGIRELSAEEAAAYGLVNRICAEGEARACALALAREISAHSPLAVRASLAAMRLDADLERQLWARSDAAEAAVSGAESDISEGVAAFFERREPAWRTTP